MRTKTLFLTVAVLVAGMIPAVAQSNPGSTSGTDVEMPLSWPDGAIYVSSDHHNDKEFVRPDWWDPTPGTGITNIVNWDEPSGGSGFSGFHSGNPYYGPYAYQDTWAGGWWPEFGQGVQTSISDGSTNVIGAPDGTSVYGALSYGSLSFSSSRFIPWLGTNDNISLQYNDQRELTMLTGGDPTSSDDELYVISGSAETVDFLDFPVIDPYNPTFPIYNIIPPQQISIGSFGSLDTNGNLYVVLPTHKSPVVTPHISSSKYSYINIHGQGYKLTSTCVASVPTNYSRTTIGVGEEISCAMSPSIGAKWSVSGGGSVSPGNTIFSSSTIFTAPNHAASVTVTATFANGSQLSKKFTVIEPISYVRAQITGTNTASYFGTGNAGAGMTNAIWIGPTTVSFYKVSIMEVGEVSTNATGYFANTNTYPTDWLDHNHHGANHWTLLTVANVFSDHASSGTCSTPWSSGSFSWTIPADWSVGGGPTNSMTGWNQVHNIDSSGKVTVQKFGHTMTRTPNDVITTQ